MFFIISALFRPWSSCLPPLRMEKTAPANKSGRRRWTSRRVVLSSVGFGRTSVRLLHHRNATGVNGARRAPPPSWAWSALVCFFRAPDCTWNTPCCEVRVLQNRKFLVGTVIGMLVQARAAGRRHPGAHLRAVAAGQLGHRCRAWCSCRAPSSWASWGPSPARLFDRAARACIGIIGTGAAHRHHVRASRSSPPRRPSCFLTVLYTVRMFSLSLVNMPITTWGMNALDNKVMNHGTSVNNTLRQVAGLAGHGRHRFGHHQWSTNARTPSRLGAGAASMLGIDVAFAVSGGAVPHRVRHGGGAGEGPPERRHARPTPTTCARTCWKPS